jgi:hypothetical protein
VVLNDHGIAWVVWESRRNIPGNSFYLFKSGKQMKKLVIKIKRNCNKNDQKCALINLNRRIRNNQRHNKPLQILKLGSFQFQGRIVGDTDASKEIGMSRDKD